MFTCPPAYSIAQGKRVLLLSKEESGNQPGPSSYALKTSWKVGVPKITSLRKDIDHTEGPGPAAYTLPESLGQAPKALITARRKIQGDVSKSESTDSLKCQRLLRVELPKEKVKPPVLRSQQRFEECPAVPHRPVSNRKSISEQRKRPSPYAKGLMEPGRLYFYCDTDIPVNFIQGPGIYQSADDLVRKSNPRAVIGTAKRVMMETHSVSPGPGQYAFQRRLRSTTYTFAKAAPQSKREDSPGPGQYDLPVAFGNHPPYFARSRAKPWHGSSANLS